MRAAGSGIGNLRLAVRAQAFYRGRRRREQLVNPVDDKEKHESHDQEINDRGVRLDIPLVDTILPVSNFAIDILLIFKLKLLKRRN